MGAIPVAAVILAIVALVLPGPPIARLHLSRSSLCRPRIRLYLGAAGVMFCILRLPVHAVAAIAIALVVCGFRYRKRKARRNFHAASSQLVHALEIVVAELRVGAHPAEAFAIAGTESSGEVGEILRAVSSRADLGGDVVNGLTVASRRSVIADQWDRLATCWRLAQHNGLPIGLLIAAAQRDIAERQRFSAQVEADLAGPRATAVTLAALPVFGVALGQLVGANPMQLLFDGGVGGWLLIVGVLLAGLGLLWSDRIAEQVHRKVIPT